LSQLACTEAYRDTHPGTGGRKHIPGELMTHLGRDLTPPYTSDAIWLHTMLCSRLSD